MIFIYSKGDTALLDASVTAEALEFKGQLHFTGIIRRTTFYLSRDLTPDSEVDMVIAMERLKEY